MLEGLVRQLLLGYLGRYVKDIQKEQLKITLWNEEVLLENVELILEAFNYLQLPFALKQGRLGRLSIKIPWKKLGWDPIIIILEDVFVCASQRDDCEWSLDSVEKREFAGKKAKLAAAELAKLSRCVGDNLAGQSFILYITAKILESIQVSIRNLHVIYCDRWSESEHITFGLKFSSLTVVKQNPISCLSSMKDVKFYWHDRQPIQDWLLVCNICHVCCRQPMHYAGHIVKVLTTLFELYACNHLPIACICTWKNPKVSFPSHHLFQKVNRSGKLDYNAAQYSITAELTGLVISLNEVQLKQILVLWDYLGTCRLREKYGRYRPWCSPLSIKLQGWQILWWHYAQESVLSDIRKKLKKTSWRYFGQRLNYCRKYVNLYKTKLDYLRREQSIDEDILRELEQMEKESDLDDILSYRSAAEHELQEFSSKSSTPKMGINVSGIDVEVSQNDDHSTGKSRGWLNWLSRGMLGAGGTEDSSQFSGVVSEEVIKDIYEATEFYLPVLSNGDGVANDMIYLWTIKFSVHQISATLWSISFVGNLIVNLHIFNYVVFHTSGKYGQEIAELCLHRVIIECKLYKESASIIALVQSGEMVHPCTKKVILLIKTPILEKGVADNKHPSCTIQVDLSPNCEVELSVKGMLQPLEVTFDAEFFMSFVEFFDVLKSLSFQQERLLSSLNGIKNANARLLSKAEYILSSGKKVMWDISIINIVVNVPWGNATSEQFDLVLEFGALLFKSKCDLGSFPSKFGEERCNLKNFLNSISTSNCSMSSQLQDLYDHFEVKLNDFEMKMRVPHHTQTISIFEKCCPSITLASCMIMDESILKQLEVYIIVSSLHAHLSPSIYGAVLELIAHLGIVFSPKNESVTSETLDPLNMTPNGWTTHIFGFSVNANLESVSLQVDIANNGDYSSALMLSLRDLDIWYALTKFEECWICMKALKITMHPPRGLGESHVLYSCGNASSTISFISMTLILVLMMVVTIIMTEIYLPKEDFSYIINLTEQICFATNLQFT